MFKFLLNLKWNAILRVVFISLGLMVNPVYAQEPVLTDGALENRAREAYNSGNWIDAVRYLTAYIQRDPDVLQNNPEYATKIQNALGLSIKELQDEAAGVGAIFHGPTPTPPPPLNPPPSSAGEMNGKGIALQNGRPLSTSYRGTTDVTLEQAIPDERTGNDPTCFVDGDDPQGTGQDRVTILRWDISAIPEGSTIINASITLNVVNSSNDVYYLYEMKRDWVENQATWYDYRNGRRWASGGASGSQDRGTTRLGSLKALNSGKAEIQLNDAGIALVQSWVNNPANNRGLVIGNDEAGAGIDFNCSEASMVANRPALTIIYTGP